MMTNQQPDRPHSFIDDSAFRTGLKVGFFAYFGVYIFAFLIGLLCTGAMLLTGYILAAAR